MHIEKKHYAIIMPGLGDHGARFRWLTSNWKRDYNIIPIIHLVGWSRKKSLMMISLMTFIHLLSN